MRETMRSPILVLLLAASACTIVETERPAGPDPVVRTARPERAWRAEHAGEPIGTVVLFRGGGESGGAFFSVRNEWQQDVGLVDELGRAWAFRPHGAEAEWLGTGTVADGAARILGVDACELVETSLPATGDAPRPASSDSREH